MTPTEQQRLQTALGRTEPLSWPNSLEEEIALTETGDPLVERFARRRKESLAGGVLAILDELQLERTGV